MPVKPIPDGYHAVTPYLIVRGASKAIAWYQEILGAEERLRMPMPDGSVGHAELQIGDSVVMLADANEAFGARSPDQIGGSPVGLCLYVTGCDAVFDAAVQAGAKVLKPMQDQFYGDRSGTFADPFGHQWTVATHIKDVSPEEMQAAMKAMGG